MLTCTSASFTTTKLSCGVECGVWGVVEEGVVEEGRGSQEDGSRLSTTMESGSLKESEMEGLGLRGDDP